MVTEPAGNNASQVEIDELIPLQVDGAETELALVDIAVVLCADADQIGTALADARGFAPPVHAL
ncbi:hypothetical protein D3C83_179610 [compost metagenome]